MICNGCGAHLIDGTGRCPFCREILGGLVKSNSDVTYKIESDNQVELIKRSSKKNVSSRKLRERRKRKKRQRMIGYAILLAMAAALVGIIIGIISFISYLFSDNTVYTTAYCAGNELGISYDGETVVLTKQLFKNEGDSGSDVPDGIISRSANGEVTAFVDRYDKMKKQGYLKVISGSDSEDIVEVSKNVYPGFKVSDDGEYVIFIKNGNEKGNMGELWVYEVGGEAVKISDKVDSDKMLFSSEADRVIYIKNYDYKKRCGDAYYTDFSDLTEYKIDSAVYMIYGTAEDSDIVLYSKDYKKDKSTFNVYTFDGEENILLTENCGSAPMFSESGEYAFVCGDKSADRFALYRVDIEECDAEKIINNLSCVERISEDGDKLLFSKKFDNDVADYYIWTDGETELKVADGVNYTKPNQVAVSEDFENIAFISNYDEKRNGGALYSRVYEEDLVSKAEKISDDVYGCFIFENERVVYTKNYSNKSKTAGLYIYDGSEFEINSEVNPLFVSVGEEIVCLYDYSDKNGGNLYRIDGSINETRVTTDVFNYYLKKNGEIVVVKTGKEGGKFDLYETYDGELIPVRKDAEKILFF